MIARLPRPAAAAVVTNPRREGLGSGWFLFANGFPHIRLGLRSGGGMHVYIAIKVEIELYKNRDQGFNMIVRRFPGIHGEVALEDDFLFTQEELANQSLNNLAAQPLSNAMSNHAK